MSQEQQQNVLSANKATISLLWCCVRVTKLTPAMLLKAFMQKLCCRSTVQYSRAALEMTAAVQH